ncbi:MAG: DNA translocase FtsK 4TM domain-containing protein, partial [Alphaproteobacteria bacterium]
MARQRRKSGARPRRTQSQFIEGVLEAIKRFLMNRALDGAGIALILLALATLLALLSHSPQDPSFTVATSKHASNWLGTIGSYSSDLLLQSFGAAAVLLVMPWFAWGAWLTFLRHRPEIGRPFWLHGVTWFLAALFIAVFASALRLPANDPMTASGVGVGGFVGDLLLGRVSNLFPLAHENLVRGIAGGFALILGILAFGYTVGFNHGDLALVIGTGVRASWRGLRFVARKASKLTQRFARTQMPMMPKVLRRRINPDEAQADDQAVFDGGGDWNHDFVPEPILDHGRRGERPQRVVQRPGPSMKTSNREKAEAQSKLNLGDEAFRLPELGLLAKPKPVDALADLTDEALEQNARLLEGVLQDFGIKGEIINVFPGPVVTLYELEPAPGIKSSRVIGLADDIARSMSAVSARVAVVPGRNAIGIELPNRKREMVVLRELLAHESFEQSPDKLLLALGKTIGGEPVVADLSRMPHLLIAGTTGSGKSVAINTMILSLVYRLTPAQCKLILIDPKMLELSVYDGIPHLLAPVVTEPKKAIVALKWVVREMEDRYRKMSKLGVRNITGYNQRMTEARESGEVLKRQVQTGFD